MLKFIRSGLIAIFDTIGFALAKLGSEKDFNKAFNFYGVRNNAEAVNWLRKAAEQGFAEAQYCLGDRYLNGEGVPQDDAKAVHWLRKAAEQGSAEAQYRLGDMYHFGEGVPVDDDAKAIAWFRKAAEQGHAGAQFSLGAIYEAGNDGDNVPQDDAKAAAWFRKAAEQGHAGAQRAETQHRAGVCLDSNYKDCD